MTREFISAKYDASILTVDYAGDDGTHLLRTGGTIAWRFNNPGNLRPAGTKLIMGAIGIGKTKSNGSFLIFKSYAEGRLQKQKLLRRKYNQRTIYTMLTGIPDPQHPGKMMMGYAPASDNNDPLAYANAIGKHTGLPITTKLADISDAKLEEVLDAMEAKEGFHGMKHTRKEKEIGTTSVTVSDGAKPKPDVPVQIKIGDKTYEKKTDQHGQLPKIAHTEPGKKAEIHFADVAGEWKKQFEFVMDGVSNAYVLLHDLVSYEAPTAPKKPPASVTTPARKPFNHLVARKETLAILAERFKTSVAAIMKDNKAIKDPSKIYVGQIIGIYGPPSSTHQSGAARPAPKAAARPAAQGGKAAAPSAPAAGAPLTRSKEGKGEPLAIVPVDQKAAPWMVVAIEEARKWAGKEEDVITKTGNFHKRMGMGGEMVNTPWCAAFANYCLKTAGAPYEKSASSQFPTSSKKFKKIGKPVYGAIMVMRNYVRSTGKAHGTGHVTFVYGVTSDGRVAGLGGNQGDCLKVSKYRVTGVSGSFKLKGVQLDQKFHAFYIPVTYEEYAKTQGEPETVDSDDVNKNFLQIAVVKDGANEKTQ
ncbi:TIGR02594 family protein [Massilia sp. DJPM01]|uniref:TIGR02594 family protein n=1 Tax=Massilia sp. DJPM01 TaxID=3024404 RepID=UPI00259F21B8|nr:TIGR02594 family protein [Massilia sp. DJPM01]MDM5179113.1 TIGR02594 family protein [Massilia sp. DJPM01]